MKVFGKSQCAEIPKESSTLAKRFFSSNTPEVASLKTNKKKVAWKNTGLKKTKFR